MIACNKMRFARTSILFLARSIMARPDIVFEYLASEVLELDGNAVRDNKKTSMIVASFHATSSLWFAMTRS